MRYRTVFLVTLVILAALALYYVTWRKRQVAATPVPTTASAPPQTAATPAPEPTSLPDPPSIATNQNGAPLPSGDTAAALPAGEPPKLQPASSTARPNPVKTDVSSPDLPQADYDALIARDLMLPLSNLRPSDIHDTFNQGRSEGRRHEATDILAPRNTPIYAMQDGVIEKLFTSKPGGLTVYEFDPQGVYCFYYAHLDHYPPNLQAGMHVKKGELIGYVGTTGDAPANTPHLHLAIMKLGPEKHWWQATSIDPYPVLMKLATR